MIELAWLLLGTLAELDVVGFGIFARLVVWGAR